jgi:hypothetical protein
MADRIVALLDVDRHAEAADRSARSATRAA